MAVASLGSIVGVGLALAQLFAKPLIYWALIALVVLSMTIWVNLVVAQFVNRIRFGARLTLDEIKQETDPVRMARLLRYHLGWSPGKIAAELNRWGVTNHGLPWRENDVRRVVKRIGR